MARVGYHMSRKLNADAAYEREQRALKRDRVMVDVPFELAARQTPKAVKFRSYGWVPRDAIRWRRADGTVVGWGRGYEGDQLMIAAEFVDRAALSPEAE